MLLVSPDEKHIQNIDLPQKPFQITLDTRSCLAYVTLPLMSSVGFVNICSRKFMKQFSCPGKVYGITTMRDGLAMGGERKIYLSSREAIV